MNQTISLSNAKDERAGLPSASAWARYEACPASWQLEAIARDLGQAALPSAEAASGERIHLSLAGLTPEPPLTDSEATSVAFLRERADDQLTRIFGESALRAKELLEQRFWLEQGGVRVASGRADRVVYLGTTALVQDYKTGFREPEPAEVNAQLKVLAVLVALELPFITEVIVQLVTGPFGILEARYDVNGLSSAYQEILATLKQIESDSEPRVGREQCRYCPAINICPALAAMQTPVAQQCQAVKLPEREAAAPLLNSIEILERQIKAVKEFYAEAMKADPTYQIPGWILAPGPQRREVKDWEAARARLAEFIEPSELDALADYSIPGVEKLLAKGLKIKQKEAGQKLAEILEGYLLIKPGNLLLKPAPRKPLTLAD